jgi:hypothetical protein
MAGDPLRAEHGRLDLIGGEHQRRQVKSLLQNITYAGLTADRHALFDQGRDVAVDGPFRCLQLGRDCICRQRFAGTPEHLNDLKQPVGASHGASLLSLLEGRHPMLTACWQQGASIPGQHSNQEEFVHDDSVRPRPLDNDVAAADTTVAAGDG